MGKYPRLTVDHNKLRSNMKQAVEWCKSAGIDVVGVIKVTTGMASAALDYESCGAKWIASSRIEQLQRAKDEGVRIPLMMIRIPMLSEIPEVVQLCDYSLQSDFTTLKALDEEALKANKKHNVILMADLGDLREGFFEIEELVDIAKHIEDKFSAVHLAGIGTNLGCYGSIVPTKEKMEQLVDYAEIIEAAIGRRLEIISGGATSSLLPLFKNEMPERINNLRIGELVFCGSNQPLKHTYGRSETDILSDEAFVLEAEVIEVKTKASHPIGELGVDAFGKKRKYKDRGLRQRALLAIGRQDYGDIDSLKAFADGVEVIGASSDHTILDIDDCRDIIRVGDVMKFKLDYSGIMYLTSSENVKVNEVDRLYGIKIK